MIQAARNAKVLLRALFKDTTRRPKAGAGWAPSAARIPFAGASLLRNYDETGGDDVAKKGRKRRNRRKSKANHGKRPNAGRK
jgi:hypothetical protein